MLFRINGAKILFFARMKPLTQDKWNVSPVQWKSAQRTLNLLLAILLHYRFFEERSRIKPLLEKVAPQKDKTQSLACVRAVNITHKVLSSLVAIRIKNAVRCIIARCLARRDVPIGRLLEQCATEWFLITRLYVKNKNAEAV